jgi:hypothetical protein
MNRLGDFEPMPGGMEGCPSEQKQQKIEAGEEVLSGPFICTYCPCCLAGNGFLSRHRHLHHLLFLVSHEDKEHFELHSIVILDLRHGASDGGAPDRVVIAAFLRNDPPVLACSPYE